MKTLKIENNSKMQLKLNITEKQKYGAEVKNN